jgi:hypothetical protein
MTVDGNQKTVCSGVSRATLFGLVACALAVLLAIPTLSYGLGSDQAAFMYVGREWLRGGVPYRDAFDIKPPGIYAAYALAMRLFGVRPAAIRVLELMGIFGVGVLAARLRRAPAGAVIVAIAAYHYCCFDYWDTAQAELWEGLALLGAFAAVELDERPRRRALVSGALSGIAFLFKFPAALVSLVIAARLWARARPSPLGALALHALAGLAVLGACIGWFAAHGALGDLVDAVIHFNAAYVANKAVPWPIAGDWTLSWLRHTAPWLVLFTVAFALAPSGWALALLGAAAVSIVLQRKFYSYHFGILTPIFALIVAGGLARLRAAPLVAAGAAALGLLLAPAWIAHPAVNYLQLTRQFWSWRFGRFPRGRLIANFTGPGGYDYSQQERIGLVARDHARPGDLLQVVSFKPVPYLISGLRSPSRFFAPYLIEDPNFTWKKEEWLAEHQRAMTAHPPRFVIAFSDDLGPDYRQLRREGAYALFERQ